MEQYTEAWAQIQVADREHYSMDPATRGKQVVHIHELPLAVAGSVEMCMEGVLLAYGKEVAAVGSHKGVAADCSQVRQVADGVAAEGVNSKAVIEDEAVAEYYQRQAAEAVNSKVVIEDEAVGEYYQRQAAVRELFEVDSTVQPKGNCNCLYFYHPEN